VGTVYSRSCARPVELSRFEAILLMMSLIVKLRPRLRSGGYNSFSRSTSSTSHMILYVVSLYVVNFSNYSSDHTPS